MISRSTDIGAALRSRQRGFFTLPAGAGAAKPSGAPLGTLIFASQSSQVGSNNWVFTNGGRSTRNQTSENSYSFTEPLGSGQWIVRLQIASVTSNAASDRYIHLSAVNQYANMASNSGFILGNAGAFQFGSFNVVTAAAFTFGANDSIDVLVNTVAGRAYFRKNGVMLNSGNPAAGTGWIMAWSPGLSPLYLGVGRNNNSNGWVGADILQADNVPSGYVNR